MAAIIFAQKQFTHYCERIQELLGFGQIPQKHRRDDLHLCPLSAVAGTTSSNLVFTKSAPPCTYLGSPIWGEGSRGSPLSEKEGGRPPIMLPPVCLSSMLKMILVLAAAKKLSNTAVSLHLAALFILQFQEVLFGWKWSNMGIMAHQVCLHLILLALWSVLLCSTD